MQRRTLLAASAALPLGALAQSPEPVDVLLVLAVDVSRSIDEDEARLQREGYRNAVSDPRVIEAIRRGMIGVIGLAYVEWSGWDNQRLVLPWTRISSQVEAAAWAAALDAAPRASHNWTSISGAIDFARRTLAEAPFEGTRRVIDVSGDGVNNHGRPVEVARDEAVAQGIIINGLPIINNRPTPGGIPQIPLDRYFEQSVIGGAGSFMIVAEDFDTFGTAVRRKLIREIA